MLNLPTIPSSDIFEYKSIISYSALSSPQNTFTVLIFGMPINYVVCGTSVKLLTTFAGAGLSSMTVSLAALVPNTILSDLYYYGLSTELTQTVTPTTFQLNGPANGNLNNVGTAGYSPTTGLYFNGPHDITAYFTSVGALLNTLTAGAIEVVIQIRPL